MTAALPYLEKMGEEIHLFICQDRREEEEPAVASLSPGGGWEEESPYAELNW